MPPLRVVADEGDRVTLDLAPQVLALDAPEDKSAAAELTPALPRSGSRPFVSAATLAMKAKQFDDGLYAAVELAAQQGAGRFAGKRSLLQALARAVPPSSIANAGDVVLAACWMGGIDVDVPRPAERRVRAVMDAFLATPARSKPIGFYTWRPSLAAIFQQDRLLQTPLEIDDAVGAMAAALQRDAELLKTYVLSLALAARLTNPLAGADLRAIGRGQRPPRVSVFPPSRSHEADVMQRMFGDASIPDGFNLIDELIHRIRTGTLRLEPQDTSGWYDHQIWSIAPLVDPDATPEAARLQLTPRYRTHLAELFKAIFALARETHIKQLAPIMAGSALGGRPPRKIVIYPELATEPLATHYLRRAHGYRFVESILQATFGDDGLSAMRRIAADGERPSSLREELSAMQALFYGAYVTVCRQLGMEPAADAGPRRDAAADAAAFASWADAVAGDPDVAADARMMVPVFFDVERQLTKAWLVLGWIDRPLSIGFATPPHVVDAPHGVPVEFRARWERIAQPVMVEAYVRRILNRDEFRRVCDAHRTPEHILAALA